MDTITNILDEIALEQAGKHMLDKTLFSGEKAISSLHISNETTTDTKKMLEFFHWEYSNIFQPKLIDEEELGRTLIDMEPKINKEDFSTIGDMVTEIEVKLAIKQLANQQSPGHDGLPTEFYKDLVYQISKNLTMYYNSTFQNGYLPSETVQVQTCLLFKGGDREDPKAWRPITLYMVDYKILSTVLGNRIKKSLQEVISTNQFACVPGQNGSNGICQMQGAFEEGKGFLCVDQSKAFDSVHRGVLQKILRRLGYPPDLRRSIAVLYQGATTRISVKRHLVNQWKSGAGYGKDAPSAPFFTCYMQSFKSLFRVRSRVQPHHGNVSFHYMDDTVVITRIREDQEYTQALLQRYSNMTGGKINQEKTRLICSEMQEGIFKEDRSGRILGVYLGEEPEKSWDRLLLQVREVRKKTNMQLFFYSRKSKSLERIWLPCSLGWDQPSSAPTQDPNKN